MSIYDIKVDYKGLDVVVQVSLTGKHAGAEKWVECDWLNVKILDDCGDVYDYVESTLWGNEEFLQVVKDKIKEIYGVAV